MLLYYSYNSYAPCSPVFLTPLLHIQQLLPLFPRFIYPPYYTYSSYAPCSPLLHIHQLNLLLPRFLYPFPPSYYTVHIQQLCPLLLPPPLPVLHTQHLPPLPLRILHPLFAKRKIHLSWLQKCETFIAAHRDFAHPKKHIFDSITF